MDTEKICMQCGKHCVSAQSFCPKCGSALPAATPRSASSSCAHKLILNKDEGNCRVLVIPVPHVGAG
jgi:hypothetical protein